MAQVFIKSTQQWLHPHKGFTLIEMAVVVVIIGIVSAVSLGLLWNTESADAALVRSVQTQLESGAKQAAMQTGNPPNDDANLTSLATYINSQLDSAASATLACGVAGAGECRLSFKAKLVYYRVGLNGDVELFDLSGFSRYQLDHDGQLVAL